MQHGWIWDRARGHLVPSLGLAPAGPELWLCDQRGVFGPALGPLEGGGMAGSPVLGRRRTHPLLSGVPPVLTLEQILQGGHPGPAETPGTGRPEPAEG